MASTTPIRVTTMKWFWCCCCCHMLIINFGRKFTVHQFTVHPNFPASPQRDKILIVTSYCMDWFWYAVKNNITKWNQMTSIFRSEYYLYILDICILHVLFCTIIWDGKWCVRRLSHSILKMEMQCYILINLYHLNTVKSLLFFQILPTVRL